MCMDFIPEDWVDYDWFNLDTHNLVSWRGCDTTFPDDALSADSYTTQ